MENNNQRVLLYLEVNWFPFINLVTYLKENSLQFATD